MEVFCTLFSCFFPSMWEHYSDFCLTRFARSFFPANNQYSCFTKYFQLREIFPINDTGLSGLQRFIVTHYSVQHFWHPMEFSNNLNQLLHVIVYIHGHMYWANTYYIGHVHTLTLSRPSQADSSQTNKVCSCERNVSVYSEISNVCSIFISYSSNIGSFISSLILMPG